MHSENENPQGNRRRLFEPDQMAFVNEAVEMAEELTSNYFKYSTSQWRRSRYDVRTLKDLRQDETTDEAFSQIIRYLGKPTGSDLSSKRFDFYKVCLQDHVVLKALDRDSSLSVLPLMTYVVTHELAHIVRFGRFIQNFETSPAKRLEEEARVHFITGEILRSLRVSGIEYISGLYQQSFEINGVPLDRLAVGN